MVRTASSLPLKGPSTLGFDPARFQTKPPARYRASWQLPGPDSHRQATTSLRTISSAATSRPYLQFCRAHRKRSLISKIPHYRIDFLFIVSGIRESQFDL